MRCAPPYFPITPAQLRGTWRFRRLEPGTADIEGFSVQSLEIPHKGGRTFGFRISDGRATLAYLLDHCPTQFGPGPDGLGEYHVAALTLVKGCDLVFYDAQYTDEELPSRAAFGHAACGYAVRLAELAGARRLLLCHHDPPRTDDEIDQIVAEYKDAALKVEAAAEALTIDLP